MKHSPHLPPPACHVSTHYKMQSLQRVLFYVFLGLLSGMAAAFAAVAWFLPTVSPIQQLSAGDRNKRILLDQPSPLFLQQAKQRLVTLYDTRDKVGAGYYRTGAERGTGVLLSSDGWVIVQDAANQFVDADVIEAVDYQGVVHRIRKILHSSQTGSTYMLLDGEGFRIMPFANWDSIEADTSVWSVTAMAWSPVTIAAPSAAKNSSPQTALEASPRYRILSSDAKESILLADDGSLVGFVNKNGDIVPGWIMDKEISEILARGVPSLLTLAWKGVWVSRMQTAEGTAPVSGFFVSSVLGTRTGLRAGDVIVRLNGKLLAPESFARLLLQKGTIELTVLRGGKEVVVQS